MLNSHPYVSIYEDIPHNLRERLSPQTFALTQRSNDSVTLSSFFGGAESWSSDRFFAKCYRSAWCIWLVCAEMRLNVTRPIFGHSNSLPPLQVALLKTPELLLEVLFLAERGLFKPAVSALFWNQLSSTCNYAPFSRWNYRALCRQIRPDALCLFSGPRQAVQEKESWDQNTLSNWCQFLSTQTRSTVKGCYCFVH